MRKLPLTIAAIAIATALAGQNQAKAQTSTPAAASRATAEDFSARRAHRHSHRFRIARHGACDGFQRCRCGVTAAQKHGLPLAYRKGGRTFNLKQASEWPEAFAEITAPQVGAVVYQGVGPSGHAHVATIVGLTGDRCKVRVADDAGTYERNICRRHAKILQVSG